MSTRLRPIVMLGSSVRAGGYARLELERWIKELGGSIPERGSMPEANRLIKMFSQIQAKKISLGEYWLWLFREPRELPASRSRYVQLCRYYGVSPVGKKKKQKIAFVREPLIRETIDWEDIRRRGARIWQEQREASQQVATPPVFDARVPMSATAAAGLNNALFGTQQAYQYVQMPDSNAWSVRPIEWINAESQPPVEPTRAFPQETVPIPEEFWRDDEGL